MGGSDYIHVVTPSTQDELLAWLRTAGGMARVRIIDVPGEGRGCAAAGPIAKGEPVVIVPRPLLITHAHAASTGSGATLSAIAPRTADATACLTAFLLDLEIDPGPWRRYVESLPRPAARLPIFFSDDELALLQGSAVLPRVHERRAALMREHDALRQLIPSLGAHSFGDFVWARTTVLSRMFRVTIDGAVTDALVPVADMLNHSTTPNVAWSYEEETAAFVMRARTDILAGAAVRDNYGEKCNSRFFQHHGFCLDDNPHNEATIVVVTNGQAREVRVTTGGAPELAELTPHDVHDACERALAAFTSTLDDDDALLASGTLPPIQRSCVAMRRGEKRVLHSVRDAIRL